MSIILLYNLTLRYKYLTKSTSACDTSSHVFFFFFSYNKQHNERRRHVQLGPIPCYLLGKYYLLQQLQVFL